MVRQLYENEKIPYHLLLLADETIEAINKYVHRSDIYVYERGHQIVGVYVQQPISNDTVEIKNIAVDTQWQGQGIGTFLLREVTAEARAKGFKKIVVGTGDAAIKQLYWYQKEGFEIFEILERFFLDNYPDPIYENGIQLKHMLRLKKELE